MRNVVAITIVLIVSVILASCGTDDESSGPAKITISVTHPDDLYGVPWTVGQKERIFDDAGVTIEEIVPSEGGGTTLQTVLSGRLPFGEAATSAIVTAAEEDAPVQAIGGGVQSVEDVKWVALNDSDLGSLKDAGEASWGYTSPGSVTEALSFLIPEEIGLDSNAIERNATGGTGEGIALLEGGDVDLAYAPPRVAIEKDDSLKIVGNSDEFIPKYQQTMIFSSRDYASKNPEVTRSLLEGYKKSVEWIRKNPRKTAEYWADAADLDVDDAEAMLDDALEADYWNAGYSAEALEAVADGLSYTHDIDAVDWSEFVTDRYLPEDTEGKLP